MKVSLLAETSNAAQPLIDGFRHQFFSKVLPFAFIAILLGFGYLLLERWSIRKVKDWKQRRSRNRR
jgi:hypothetical protein